MTEIKKNEFIDAEAVEVKTVETAETTEAKKVEEEKLNPLQRVGTFLHKHQKGLAIGLGVAAGSIAGGAIGFKAGIQNGFVKGMDHALGADAVDPTLPEPVAPDVEMVDIPAGTAETMPF